MSHIDKRASLRFAAFRHLSTVPMNDRQKFIVNMFQHAWKGYKQSAWGHDHAHPISKTSDDWFGVALTMLDAVDTMYIMGLETGLCEGLALEIAIFNENISTLDI